MTTLKDYAKQAAGTDHSPQSTEYYMIGLSGEIGESCNEFKKVLRDDYGIMSESSRAKILLELGDSLWYIARLADHLGSSLDEIALDNLIKLQMRYKK